MPIRFRHVCLTVTDLERSIAFYCENLGFTEGPAFCDEAGRRYGIFLYLNNGDFLELFEGDDTRFSGHICFEVDDVVRVSEELRARGIKVGERCLGRSKAWMAFFQDPDGYAIELNEFSPPDSWIGQFLAKHDPAQTLPAGGDDTQ